MPYILLQQKKDKKKTISNKKSKNLVDRDIHKENLPLIVSNETLISTSSSKPTVKRISKKRETVLKINDDSINEHKSPITTNSK